MCIRDSNISTRRLNVIESSVIDIIPPNDMPQKDKSSLLDVLMPTVLSTGGMLGARFLDVYKRQISL